jgi:CMP/dCMP kinase
MSDNIPVITIDGPSGSGKGTVSQLLAQSLGFHFLDSGALYRLLALKAEAQLVDFSDEISLVALAESFDFGFDDGVTPPMILLDGVDVSLAIRTPSCSHHASVISKMAAIRETLNQRMRDMRKKPGLVADGRDMGTVVFQDAFIKFFLDANLDIRANRRAQQLQQKGLNVNLAQISKEIADRDERDTNREVAPLRPADDAIIIDTSNMSIEQVLRRLADETKARL